MFEKPERPQPVIPNDWNELPLFLNTKIISKLIGASMAYLNKCIAIGELKATKKAGKWLVDKDDFKNWMQSGNLGLEGITDEHKKP